MIDFHQEIVKALETIELPVHYEMFLKSGTETPCISYLELTNFVETQSDITDITTIQYQIKIWDNSIGTIQRYAPEVDKVMRALGFKRVSAQELYDTGSSMIQKVFTYEAKALDFIN